MVVGMDLAAGTRRLRLGGEGQGVSWARASLWFPMKGQEEYWRKVARTMEVEGT